MLDLTFLDPLNMANTLHNPDRFHRNFLYLDKTVSSVGRGTEQTSLYCIGCGRCLLHMNARYNPKKFFCICSCGYSSIRLPVPVLVSVGIVTNPSYHEAWEVGHKSRCLHLKANYAPFLSKPLSRNTVPHNLICRAN
jgi:hypothetical protein